VTDSLLKLLVAAMLLPSDGRTEGASPRVCRGMYAMCYSRWQCRASLRAFRNDPDPCVSVLWGTWNDSGDGRCPCLERFMRDPRPKSVELHAANDVCTKPGRRNCGRYELLFGYSSHRLTRLILQNDRRARKLFAGRYREIAGFLARHLRPGDECLFSPLLETLRSRAVGRRLIAWARPFFPACRMVWNPLQLADSRDAA